MYDIVGSVFLCAVAHGHAVFPHCKHNANMLIGLNKGNHGNQKII